MTQITIKTSALALLAGVPMDHAQTADPAAAGLSGPGEVKGENWRGRPFFEILFMNRVAGGPAGIGNYFNSLGNSFEVSDEVIGGRFRSLDAETPKNEYGSDGDFFNGPRRFVANGFTGASCNDCKLRVIDTIPLYLYGMFEVPSLDEFVSGPPAACKVPVSKRTNTFTFNKGEVATNWSRSKGRSTRCSACR